MKKVKFSLAAFAFLSSAITVQAQSVDSIISKHLAAIGGKDKISSINSMTMETSTSVMGNDNTATVTILNGKGYKMEMSMMGQPFIQTITDKGGWMINGSDTQAMPDEQYNVSKDQINIGSPFLNYPANGYKAVFDGIDTTGGAKAYKLKLTSPAGVDITDYIDASTYYTLKTVVSTGGQETTIAFSNYKKTDFGYVMPFTIQTTLPQGFTINSTITKVTFNQPVDPKIFDMPK